MRQKSPAEYNSSIVVSDKDYFVYCTGALFDLGLMPVGDGMTGMAGCSLARSIQARQLYSQADATLAAAEANKGKLTSQQYVQQCNKANDLFHHAQQVDGTAPGKKKF